MRIDEVILREYNRDITAQKLGLGLLQKFRKEPQQWQDAILPLPRELSPEGQASAINNLLSKFERGDPTPNKQYVPWMLKSYINTPHQRMEDAITKPTEYLRKYFKLVQKKQIPQPNNDINRIPNFTALTQIVDQYPDVIDEPKNVDRGQAKQYYDDADIRVIIPEDKTAACYYGQGTKWCTAGRDNNMFDRYNSEGEMYIIIPKKSTHPGEKYQFHFQTRQFMNEKDQRINLSDLRARWPQLATIFAQQAKEHNVLALDPEITDVAGTMQKAIPVFQHTLANSIARQAKPKAKEIYVELGRAIREFRGQEEIWELAEDLFDKRGISELVLAVTYIIRDNPEIADDEDQLFDMLSEPVTQFVRERELWLYCMELLEDLGDEESEFDCAMTIEGELVSMLQKVVPEAFGEAISITKQQQ
jgi:hypothetical protein